MDYSVKVLGENKLSTYNELLPEFKAYEIPGSFPRAMRSASSLIMIQRLLLNGFEVYYNVFVAGSDETIIESFDSPCVFLQAMLRGIIENKLQDAGDIVLREGQFNIVSAPAFKNTFHLHKDFEYEILRVVVPAEHMIHHLSFHPAFEDFKTKIINRQTAILTQQEVYMDTIMSDMIFTLIHAPYADSIKKFHIDICSHLLAKALNNIAQLTTVKKSFSINYIERIHAAKEFIDNRLPEHFTISQIAHKIKMNEQKLKQGFKDMFGIGLYGYLRQQVLHIARIQLEQTDKPIKEIAMLANYNSQSNFATAFKKQFGKTPAEWRADTQDQ